MLKTCPHSCGVCEGLACEDHNVAQCLLWGESECTNNPLAVMKDCPQMCGVCTTVCKDKDESCPQWQEAGECDKNSVTLELCPYSCGICRDASKDEL
jgi:hypothetical protein